MFTLSNLLSFLRLPLAALLFSSDPLARVVAIGLAMVSDMLDGYYARTVKCTSRLGTLLDPATDKFFVLTALAILISEGQLKSWEASSFLFRDLSILFFSIYLWISGQFSHFRSQAIICGKITTSLQFGILIALMLNAAVPPLLYGAMALFGGLSLVELNFILKRQSSKAS